MFFKNMAGFLNFFHKKLIKQNEQRDFSWTLKQNSERKQNRTSLIVVIQML